MAELVRRFPGVRLTRTGRVVEALIPGVIEQKITGVEARADLPPAGADLRQPGSRTGRERRASSCRPSPAAWPPSPTTPTTRWVSSSGEPTSCAASASSRRGWRQASPRDRSRPGRASRRSPASGPGRPAEATRIALGDPDAVSVGDFHLPSLVAFSLAGETEADDARMLELLEPYRGQRARVVRLLELGGRSPARRAPRMAARAIERL